MATLQAPAPLQAVISSVGLPDVSDGLKRPLEVSSLPPGAVLSLPPPTTASSSVELLEPLSKKAKQQQHHQSVVSSDDEAGASTGTSIATKKKKPQMKYDPDVPMSKEEATAWRREQRRKRNRESAAASRQRQRDRISELEAEVAQYKKAYDAVQDQIKALEEQQQKHPTTSVVSVSRSETPEPVPSILTTTQPASPTTSTFLDLNAGDGIVDKPILLPTKAFSQEQQLQQPFKMISRHAVQNHSPTTISEAKANPCPVKLSTITALRRLCLGLS